MKVTSNNKSSIIYIKAIKTLQDTKNYIGLEKKRGTKVTKVMSSVMATEGEIQKL